MILAKPVVENQYWILKKDNQKIGQLEVNENGNCTIRINDNVVQYKTIKMAREAVNIAFEPPEIATPLPPNMVYGHEVAGDIFNPLWDVKHKLPLFTREDKSKSWFAAGWYRVRRGSTWQVMRDPKLISLQRYEYAGPFHTEQEAAS